MYFFFNTQILEENEINKHEVCIWLGNDTDLRILPLMKYDKHTALHCHKT